LRSLARKENSLTFAPADDVAKVRKRSDGKVDDDTAPILVIRRSREATSGWKNRDTASEQESEREKRFSLRRVNTRKKLS
jgi:hypothetical protein